MREVLHFYCFAIILPCVEARVDMVALAEEVLFRAAREAAVRHGFRLERFKGAGKHVTITFSGNKMPEMPAFVTALKASTAKALNREFSSHGPVWSPSYLAYTCESGAYQGEISAFMERSS